MKPLVTSILLLCLTGLGHAAKPPASAVAEGTGGSALPAQIRVLVAMGPSSYFFRDGRVHGVEYAWLLEFEKFVNQGRGKSRTSLQFIPLEPTELIPALFDGKGDMAAGLLPVSEGARHLVAFTEPFIQDRWCVMRNRSGKALPDMDQLAEAGVKLTTAGYARRLLLDLNEARRREGKAEVAHDSPGGGVTQEKLLADANKDPSRYLLSSQFLGALWGGVFSKTTTDFCLEKPVPVAWAVHKEKTAVLAALNRFIAAKKNSFVRQGVDLTRRYLHPDGVGKASRVLDPLDKLAFFAPVMQFAAKANGLDWLLLAAIGQRESGLTEVVRKRGPTGVMQVDPVTARSMGVKNPHDTTQNVTAAARYLSYLREQFASPEITAEDQLYFMLAAYNAGEGRLKSLRAKAAAQGLDPNRWTGNVEKVARETAGKRMVDYVLAVSRYYHAYQSAGQKSGLGGERASATGARVRGQTASRATE
ncbi:Membrane-bound lytic murein transglycosylase MltF [Formivibrio citricus]|uniref:Membrane-bound lytic murein transglycosylase MltF n=1 Tax=Formivibrio citricus TaxID=83765 RepID=A0A1I5BT89_9NEIS|nr:transglycosylase SLT domain-containing protein [Formivibrio citricus]SFN77858.1 Membrane-bound lytic murein transglycosylase MltF [Formivibrio citricus]